MTLELINTIGLFTSPVIAVVVTLVWQSFKEKRERNKQRKDHLFLTLMAHRRSQPPRQEWVDALNLIDVVFADTPSVLRLWHEYYDLLGSANYREESSKRVHKHLELLSAMAVDLGYRSLSQTDIDKYYSPIAHGNENDLNWRLRTELLRVLSGAQQLVIPSLSPAPIGSEPGLGNDTTTALPQAPPNAGTPASGTSQ